MTQKSSAHYVSTHEDEDIECVFSPEIQVIRNNTQKIMHLLQPLILCPYLRPCLTPVDEQQIQAKHSNFGDIIATVLLLDLLIRRSNFWNIFIAALKNEKIRQSDIAEELETELIKYKEKHEEEVKAFAIKYTDSSTSDQDNVDAADSTSAPVLKRKLVDDRNDDDSDVERCAKQSRDSSDSENEYKDALDVCAVTNTVKKLTLGGVNITYIDLEKRDYKPRKYQLALAKPAQEGHNTIICAPTGSGKTMVASLICKEHLERSLPVKNIIKQDKILVYDQEHSLNQDNSAESADDVNHTERTINHGNSSTGAAPLLNKQITGLTGAHNPDEVDAKPKILVIVPRFAILLHVYKELTTALPLWRVGKKSGATKIRMSLEILFQDHEVMVVTADIFKNAMLSDTDKCMAITDPTLIVFDECHYTMMDHSYNIIMAEYLKVKYKTPSAKLPQIVGLSASPGAGRKVSDRQAQERILTLCANLDAEVFATVPANLQEELEKYVSTPTKHTTIVSNRSNDPFSECVTKVMKTLELSGGIESGVPERGTQEYESLIVLKTQAAVRHNQDDKRKTYEHLTHYNRALILVKQARIIDGYNYLDASFKQLHVRKTEDKLDKTELYLLEKYEDLVRIWDESISCEANNHHNPKLQQLKQGIMNHIQHCQRKQEDFRAIIFVKTKLLTKALQEWMFDDTDLVKMKPEVLTSIHAYAESGGMTNAQQAATLTHFKEGDTKIIISTSVGEEGIDIPECNMVVKYDHVTNEIAMVQSRGRARKYDAVELVIGDLTVAEKDKVNVLLEQKMENAIKAVQMAGNEEFQKNIEQIQRFELAKRQQKAEKQNELKNMYAAEDITLKCKGCGLIVCKVSDIKILGQNSHINPDPEFRTKVKFEESTSQKEQDLGIERICCASCGAKWGITAGNHPCLGLKSFITVIKGTGNTIKQWSKMPCTIQKYR